MSWDVDELINDDWKYEPGDNGRERYAFLGRKMKEIRKARRKVYLLFFPGAIFNRKTRSERQEALYRLQLNESWARDERRDLLRHRVSNPISATE